MNTHIYIRMYTHIYTYTYTYIMTIAVRAPPEILVTYAKKVFFDIHSHTHTHIYTYIYIYIYMHACVYTHTHTHIYMHTHMYILTTAIQAPPEIVQSRRLCFTPSSFGAKRLQYSKENIAVMK